MEVKVFVWVFFNMLYYNALILKCKNILSFLEAYCQCCQSWTGLFQFPSHWHVDLLILVICHDMTKLSLDDGVSPLSILYGCISSSCACACEQNGLYWVLWVGWVCYIFTVSVMINFFLSPPHRVLSSPHSRADHYFKKDLCLHLCLTPFHFWIFQLLLF